MRSRWLLILLLLCGCDDEARYADGTLWESVVPVNPGRMAPKDMGQREWARFLSESGVQGADVVKPLTPVWGGFSAVPTAPLKYMDFGAIVMIWADEPVLGTSNDNVMYFDGLPDEIKPTVGRLVSAWLVDNSTVYSGFVGIENTISDRVNFYLSVVSGTKVSYQNNQFTNSGQKGVSTGFLIVYAK